MLQRLNAVEQHLHSIADRKFPPRSLADNLARVLVEHVTIARERVNRDQPFDEQILQLNKEVRSEWCL